MLHPTPAALQPAWDNKPSATDVQIGVTRVILSEEEDCCDLIANTVT